MTQRRVTDEQYGRLQRRMAELSRRVEEGTLSFDKTMDGLQALIEERSEGAGNIFSVTVDYNMTVEEMVAAGCYDRKNWDIDSKNFKVEGRGRIEVDLELVHFGRVMSSDEVLKELYQKGLRPAKLEELLAFGAKYPDEQRKYPVVALGSVWRLWNGDRRIPSLGGNAGSRGLDLIRLDGVWDVFCRFAAVRK